MSADSTTNGSGGESAAPLSTAEIASQVIESYEQPAETTTESQTPPAETPKGEPPTLSDEEQILHRHGFKQQFKPDGREHYLARSRVLKVVADAIKHGRGAWEPEKKTLTEELEQLRGFRDGFRQDFQGDELAFLTRLADVDPRYRRFLEQKVEQARQEAPDDEPKADIDLGNGASTFSPQQLQKWLQWAVKGQLAPYQKEREERERRAAEEKAEAEMGRRVHQQLDDAASWPNWGEYAPDVLRKLQDDTRQARAKGQRPQMTLKEAYLEVKAERLATSASSAREQAIADLRKAPRSTGLQAGTEVPRASGPLTTADIARRNLERLERGGS